MDRQLGLRSECGAWGRDCGVGGGVLIHEIVKKGGGVLCWKEKKGEARRPRPAAAGGGGVRFEMSSIDRL